MRIRHFFSKTLLAMGVLALGLSQSQLIAGDPPQPLSTYTDDEGSSVQIMPDGSKTIKKKDGTLIQVKPNGAKTVNKPDGTIIEIKPGS